MNIWTLVSKNNMIQKWSYLLLSQPDDRRDLLTSDFPWEKWILQSLHLPLFLWFPLARVHGRIYCNFLNVFPFTFLRTPSPVLRPVGIFALSVPLYHFKTPSTGSSAAQKPQQLVFSLAGAKLLGLYTSEPGNRGREEILEESSNGVLSLLVEIENKICSICHLVCCCHYVWALVLQAPWQKL